MAVRGAATAVLLLLTTAVADGAFAGPAQPEPVVAVLGADSALRAGVLPDVLPSSADGLVSIGREILHKAGFLARYALGALGFVVLALLLRLAPLGARAWGLTAGSLLLLALLVTPLVALLFALYLVVFYAAVEHLPPGRLRTTLLVALLLLQIAGPIWWLPLLPGYEGRAREYMAFATNLTLLRFWGYAYDRSRRAEPERPRFVDYALFMSFFPSFVNGPLVSHVEFKQNGLAWFWGEGPRPRLLAWISAERVAIGRALLGVALGFFVVFVVIRPFKALYDAALGGGVTTWPHAFHVYLFWYLSFTAWTEAAIGFGRLSGTRLPENFNAPHFAYGTADFWRRWNMTFMVWLRRFIYLPLGGAYLRGRDGERHLEWRNTAAVFGFVALYHLGGGLKLLGTGYYPWTAYVPWLLWALLNSAAVLATRGLKRPPKLGAAAVGVIVLTLLFSSIGHMTAMFPPHDPLGRLLQLYRALFWP